MSDPRSPDVDKRTITLLGAKLRDQFPIEMQLPKAVRRLLVQISRREREQSPDRLSAEPRVKAGKQTNVVALRADHAEPKGPRSAMRSSVVHRK